MLLKVSSNRLNSENRFLPCCCCAAASTRDERHIWGDRIIRCQDCSKRSAVCRVTAQDAEEIERHWVSFRPNAIFCPSNLLKSDMLDFWSVKDIFLGVQRFSLTVRNTKEDTVGPGQWRRTEQGPFCPASFSFWSVHWTLSTQSEPQSAWTWFWREEVFISGMKECRWWTSWDQRKDSIVGVYSALSYLHFMAHEAFQIQEKIMLVLLLKIFIWWRKKRFFPKNDKCVWKGSAGLAEDMSWTWLPSAAKTNT